MVLAFVGPAPAVMSYPVFNALAASGTAAGAIAASAQAAALAALAGATAAAVGAGVGGFFLGQAILQGLEQPPILPDMGAYYEAGNPGTSVRIKYNYSIDGEPVFTNAISQEILAPAKGMFHIVENNATKWFLLDRNNERAIIVSSQNTTSGTKFELLEFLFQGQPIAPTKRLPSFTPTRPDRPVVPAPTVIPLPGFGDFPITPIVIPNPGNEPGEDNEERPPGLIVQIPQTGQQIEFRPDGVRIGNYSNPSSRPFVVPVPTYPTRGGTVATPPCCPTSDPPDYEPDFSEILCRIRTLQEKILDDGTDNLSGTTAAAQSGFYEELAKDFYKVQIDVTQAPSNLRIQPSTAPALDVWFVGWFAWVENGFPGERKPLHFQNQTFLAPPNVSGFMYQVNFGCLARANWQRRVKRPYVDECVVP